MRKEQGLKLLQNYNRHQKGQSFFYQEIIWQQQCVELKTFYVEQCSQKSEELCNADVISDMKTESFNVQSCLHENDRQMQEDIFILHSKNQYFFVQFDSIF